MKLTVQKIAALCGIGLGLFLSENVQAQVIYKKLSPEIIMGINSEIYLDIDQDGANDLRIYHQQSNGDIYLRLSLTDWSNEFVSDQSGYTFVSELESGVTIDNTSNKTSGGGYLAVVNDGVPSTLYDWSDGAVNKFVGVILKKNGVNHYGWICMDVSADISSYTIKSYAFERLPDVGINTVNIENGYGAIKYSDIDPDVTIGAGLQYFIDFDEDGKDDASIYQNGTGADRYIPVSLFGSGKACITSFAGTSIVQKLDFGTVIGSSLPSNDGFGYLAVINGGVPNDTYQWNNGVQNKYLGVVLTINGQIHYGWVCLDIASDNLSFTVKSWAYEKRPDTPIRAGYVPVSDATGFVATDVTDNGNASDIQISFTKASDETNMDGYRVMLVPAEQEFTQQAAESLSADKYFSIPKSGADIQATLPAALTDVNGAAISLGVAYKIYLLSVSNVIGYAHSFSVGGDIVLGVATGITGNTSEAWFWNTEQELIVSGLESEGTISLVDLKGNEVLRSNIDPANNAFNISALTKGLYIVKISDDNKLYFTGKLVK